MMFADVTFVKLTDVVNVSWYEYSSHSPMIWSPAEKLVPCSSVSQTLEVLSQISHAAILRLVPLWSPSTAATAPAVAPKTSRGSSPIEDPEAIASTCSESSASTCPTLWLLRVLVHPRMVSSHRARVGPNMVPLPKKYTLWLFNMAMENGPFIVSFPIKNCDCPWLC